MTGRFWKLFAAPATRKSSASSPIRSPRRSPGRRAIEVYTSYLTKDLATQIVADCGEFDTVYLRHVVEHVSDLERFFAAVRMLLRPDGLLVLELPDVEEGFALGSPAILWEEHVSYFTQALAEYMLERFGFHISDRRRYVFGGGSIAFVAQKKAVPVSCTIPRPDPSADARLAARLRRRHGTAEERDQRASFRWRGRTATRSLSTGRRRGPACWSRSVKSPR